MNTSIHPNTTIFSMCLTPAIHFFRSGVQRHLLQTELLASLGSVGCFRWVQNMALSAQICIPMFASLGKDNRVSAVWKLCVTFNICTMAFLQSRFPGRLYPHNVLPLFPVQPMPAAGTVNNPLVKENLKLNFSINCISFFLKNTHNAMETYLNFLRLRHFDSSPEQMMKRGGLRDAMSFFAFCSHIEYILTSVPLRLSGGIRAIREKRNFSLKKKSRIQARTDGRQGICWWVDPRHLTAACTGSPFCSALNMLPAKAAGTLFSSWDLSQLDFIGSYLHR